jgi:hypothetical protein
MAGRIHTNMHLLRLGQRDEDRRRFETIKRSSFELQIQTVRLLTSGIRDSFDLPGLGIRSLPKAVHQGYPLLS